MADNSPVKQERDMETLQTMMEPSIDINSNEYHPGEEGQEGADEGVFREESGVLFYVNRGSFPINEFTWERMWQHVGKIHPGGNAMLEKTRYAQTLPEIPVPQAPLSFSYHMPVAYRIDSIQKYMNTLQYNHTGTQFYEIRKYRPLSGLMDMAKDMIREALPIKCLEAVILGIYLTNGMPSLERFSIGFKSVFNGHVHRHVVLGLYFNGKWGALGMSRRDDLMYKPFVFKTLTNLILDYKTAYEKYGHKLKKVKVGMPIPHDSHSCESLPWKGVALDINSISTEEVTKQLEKHAKYLRSQVRTSTQVDVNTSHAKSPGVKCKQPNKPIKRNGASGKAKKDKLTPIEKATTNTQEECPCSPPTTNTSIQECTEEASIELSTGTPQESIREKSSDMEEDESKHSNSQKYEIRI